MVNNKKRKLIDSYSEYAYNREGLLGGGWVPKNPLKHVKIVTWNKYGNKPSDFKKTNPTLPWNGENIISTPEYDLERFKYIQEKYFDIALRELNNWRRKTNWTSYIFPQIRWLRNNDMAETYSISCMEEAIKYYDDEFLKRNLKVISMALFHCSNWSNPEPILWKTDAMKVKSCMTLFHKIDPKNQIFKDILDKYYHWELDEKTLNILE